MNKFTIALAFFTVAAFAASAQTSSGNMMVGGGLEFWSRSYQGGNSNDGSEISFTPGFGYFVSDNFAVGSSLLISSERQGTGSNKTIYSSFGLAPFARYYKFTSNEKFGFFGEAEFSFATYKTDPPVGDVTKGNQIRFSLSPGAVFFFNEHWAVEFMVTGFAVTSTDPDKDEDDDKRTTVEFGLNSLQPSLGFRYHF